MYRQQNSENILKFRFSFVQSCDMMMPGAKDILLL